MMNSTQSLTNMENQAPATSPKSPIWIKPSETFSLRQRLKRQNPAAVLQPVDQNIPQQKRSVLSVRRASDIVRNPFRKSPKKKHHRDTGTENGSASLSSALSNLSKREATIEARLPSSVYVSSLDESANFGLLNPHFPKDAVKGNWAEQLPIDWSLKTKVRFVSPKPFPWRGSLTTSEESSGTTGFVRCLHASNRSQTYSLDTSPSAQFYQNCLLWMHPFFSWLRLFPRNDSASLAAKNSIPSLFVNNQKLTETIHSDWCDSFRSLYQLVKARQCPFFYVCAPTFTVLFRAAGVAGIPGIHALVTPTTRGLRQALREEDIHYIMPLREGGSDSQSDATMDTENSLSEFNETVAREKGCCESQGDTSAPKEDAASDEDEPGMWLESLGLNQSDYPALNPKRIKLEKEKHKVVDKRPQSLVYLEGTADVQALFNFLLNSSCCVAATGPVAGVPATLLAPNSFHGAVLRSLKIRQATMKQKQQDIYFVEMSGAILPNMVQGMTSLLFGTQEGQFSAQLATQSPTASFAQFVPRTGQAVPVAFTAESLKDCGLSPACLQQLCRPNVATPGIVSEVAVDEGKFTWR